MTPEPSVRTPGIGSHLADPVSDRQRSQRDLSEDAAKWAELHDELQSRTQFEQLITDLSAAFVEEPLDRFDDVIDSNLRALTASLGIDRSSLTEFHSDGQSIVLTHSYAVAGSQPFSPGVLDHDRLPWALAQARHGNTVFVRHLDDLPSGAENDRRDFLAQGIRSNATVPLKADGRVIGALAFDFLQAECQWDDIVVHGLPLVGSVFANALLHKHDQQALRLALEEDERLRGQLAEEGEWLRESSNPKQQHRRLIGKSAGLLKVLAEAECVAKTDSPVLLLGETGTGKELLAETIHEISLRSGRQMVVVNCASLPPTLIENELFGREAGAYTGAVTAQIGRFAAADGSTLFLDEIGELPIELQSKLLRVLENGRFERLGSPTTTKVNVRLIAATNSDLAKGVQDGKFRADLFHRLNVFPIQVPPLRERREDIPLLISAFVKQFNQRMGKQIKRISAGTIRQVQQYAWPGNIRELRNIIERAMILSTSDVLHTEIPESQPVNRPRPTLQQSMREQILAVLQETGWRIRGVGGAAAVLGLKATTLEARMAKLRIKRPRQNSNIS